MCETSRSDADDALETALHILEALKKAKDAQAKAEEAITKAQGQIDDIETSLDNVRICVGRQQLLKLIWMLSDDLVDVGDDDDDDDDDSILNLQLKSR